MVEFPVFLNVCKMTKDSIAVNGNGTNALIFKHFPVLTLNFYQIS